MDAILFISILTVARVGIPVLVLLLLGTLLERSHTVNI